MSVNPMAVECLVGFASCFIWCNKLIKTFLRFCRAAATYATICSNWWTVASCWCPTPSSTCFFPLDCVYRMRRAFEQMSCFQSVCLLFWLLIRFEASSYATCCVPANLTQLTVLLCLHHQNWNRLQPASTWFSFALKRKETIYGIRILVRNRHSLKMADNSFTGDRFVWFDALMPLDRRSRRRGGPSRAKPRVQ